MSSGVLGVPTRVLSGIELRDVELVLMRVLSSGHEIGGAVDEPPDEPDGADSLGEPPRHVPTGAPRIRVPLDPSMAQEAIAAGALELVDDELTPIAQMHDVRRVDGGLEGDLTRRRWRESGDARTFAITDADLADDGALTAAEGLTLLVMARPPVAADQDGLAAIAGQSGPILVLVPDRPEDTHGVPTRTLVGTTQRLAARMRPEDPPAIRLIPAAWRGADSDRALLGALGRRFGADSVLALGVGADAPAESQWRSALAQLTEGLDPTPIDALDPADEAALRLWRPLRSDRGVVLMFSGLSGSGKSTLARAVSDHLTMQTTRTVSLLDGDVVRRMLSSGLGFDRASRILNVTRIGYVAAEIARHGGVAICAPIAPYADTRAAVKAMVDPVGDFLLIHVSTPLAECERRDLKGLYAKARAGLIPEFTGISDPYDVPEHPALRIDTSTMSRDDAVDIVISYLADGGWIRTQPPAQT